MNGAAAAAARVLVVTPGFPADEADTACVPALQLALRRVVERHPGLRVTVLALHYPPRRGRYRWHGLEVVAVGGSNRRWPLRLLDLARAVRAGRREGRFDRVHAFWLTDAALVAHRLARRLGRPLEVTVMGRDALPGNPYLRLLPRAGLSLVAVSERSAADLARGCGRPVEEVVPWGVDPPAAPCRCWAERPVDLLGVGSLQPVKRFEVLLEAAAALGRVGPAPRAVLVGDGPERPRLEALARALGLGGRLELTGALPRERVLELMGSSRVLVHPSRYEGHGLVFQEALAHGMSVVSGPVGIARADARWRLADGAEGFAAACCGLLESPPGTASLVLHPLDLTADAYARRWGAVG